MNAMMFPSLGNSLPPGMMGTRVPPNLQTFIEVAKQHPGEWLQYHTYSSINGATKTRAKIARSHPYMNWRSLTVTEDFAAEYNIAAGPSILGQMPAGNMPGNGETLTLVATDETGWKMADEVLQGRHVTIIHSDSHATDTTIDEIVPGALITPDGPIRVDMIDLIYLRENP